MAENFPKFLEKYQARFKKRHESQAGCIQRKPHLDDAGKIKDKILKQVKEKKDIKNSLAIPTSFLRVGLRGELCVAGLYRPQVVK